MSEFTFDVALANRLKIAMTRNGITDAADINWLTEGDNIAQVRRVRLGHAEIITPDHIIDCDANPHIPDGWSVEEHQKGGAFHWNAANVALHLDKGQRNGKWIEGYKLRKALAKQPVLNANVLDYLLAHLHLIPEEWKGRGRAVFFWGTIYRHRGGSLYVRCLFWSGGRWRWNADWLGHGWFDNWPAAVSAS
jgi:hypothetical protein